MREELLKSANDLQSFLYRGYKDVVKTNTEWLSKLTLMCINFFTLMHCFLSQQVKDDQTSRVSNENQSFLLCARQITLCIKYLEKTTAEENLKKSVLTTSRKFFFDRIFWCLGRLKNTINIKSKHQTDKEEDISFIDLLDYILESLAAFIKLLDDKKLNNVAADLMKESKIIEESVVNLLSMVMTFSNISLESDRVSLNLLSQNLFRVWKNFKEEEFSFLSKDKHNNTSDQRIKVFELENALYKLENHVNDSLLRLVYQVFCDVNNDPIAKIQNAASQSKNAEVEKFDKLIERYLLIGQFAISFCKDKFNVLSVIRSCLASIETLDSYLIPAITSQTNDQSIDLLKQHFFEESFELQRNVHLIIDTKAFCGSLMEQIENVIDSNKIIFDKSSLYQTIDFSNILLTHLNINSDNLNIMQDKVLKFYFTDYKLILNECEAILNFPEPIDEFERRVLKRFNILKNTVKKLINAVKINSNEFDENNRIKCDISVIAEYPDYFNSIRPSAIGSILYKSKRSSKNPKNSSFKMSIKKKSESLRMAIFRKNYDVNLQAESIDGTNNDTDDLHITEILDQLSDLSIHIKKK